MDSALLTGYALETMKIKDQYNNTWKAEQKPYINPNVVSPNSRQEAKIKVKLNQTKQITMEA